MSRCTAVTVNNQSCVQCAEQPYIAAVPAQTIVENIYGWNGSAYSSQKIAGDIYTEFTVALSVGVVCGFAEERKSSDPRDIPHGFYCYQDAGRFRWAIAESGLSITAPATWVPNVDLFRIERRRATVSYFVNNRRVHVSTVPSETPLRVVCSMYSSNDGVY